MIANDYTVSVLATLMANEPADDALLGFTCAGLIVRNRVLAGWDGGSWLTIISKHDRYSANIPSSPRVLKFGDPNHDAMFRRVLSVAENIFNGREKDLVEGAIWYGRLNDCSDWFKENIIRAPQAHPMIATVGRQMFFL
jgi:hypothetical protein